jgi:hypothetical protein
VGGGTHGGWRVRAVGVCGHSRPRPSRCPSCCAPPCTRARGRPVDGADDAGCRRGLTSRAPPCRTRRGPGPYPRWRCTGSCGTGRRMQGRRRCHPPPPPAPAPSPATHTMWSMLSEAAGSAMPPLYVSARAAAATHNRSAQAAPLPHPPHPLHPRTDQGGVDAARDGAAGVQLCRHLVSARHLRAPPWPQWRPAQPAPLPPQHPTWPYCSTW